jgi:hypothetical protein
MTFDELIHSFPNGFHDAELRRLEMDYERRCLAIDLVLWIGDRDDHGRRETYRAARVTLSRVAFLVIEPPDTGYDWLTPGRVTIDAGPGCPPQSDARLPESPEGNSTSWVYLGEMNRFLLFSASEATLEWIGPEENRTRRTKE